MSQQESYPKIYLYKRIFAAKLFIDNNFAEAIDLNNIADEAFFSKFHFIRIFKGIYKKTPHQYLITVRISKAKLLLASGMTATQSCYAVGFESIGSFTSLFKRMVGLTPSAYSAMMLEKRIEIANAPLNFIPNCFAEKKGWVKHSNFEEVG